MKKVILLLILLRIFNVSFAQQKNENAAEIVAGTTALAASIFLTAAAWDEFIESLEHEATEWILTNKPEFQEFSLSLLNLKDEHYSNFSNLSSCTFIVKPKSFDPFVMMWIVGPGWWNDYGVVFESVTVEIFDKERWEDVVLAYIQTASDIKITSIDSIPVYSIVPGGIKYADKKIEQLNDSKPELSDSAFPKMLIDTASSAVQVLEGIMSFKEVKSMGKEELKFEIVNEKGYVNSGSFPFRILEGDSYVVKDIGNLKVVFNEKNFHLFFPEIMSLVKFKKRIFEKITEELL